MSNVRIILLAFISSVCFHAKAQLALKWAQMIYTQDFTIRVTDATKDSVGNVYACGWFLNTIDIDPGPNEHILTNIAGGRSMFIAKFDTDGNLIWVGQISSTQSAYPRKVAITSNGDLVCVGSFKGTADFDPGSGVLNLTSYYATDPATFLIRLTNQGNLLWAKKCDGVGSSVSFISTFELQLDEQDNIYLSGYFHGSIDFDPGSNTQVFTSQSNKFNPINSYLLKLNTNGDFQWTKTIWGQYSISYSVAILDVNNVTLFVEYNDTIDADPGPNTSYVTGGGSIILRLDSSGQFVFYKKISGASIINSVVDGSKNLVLTGNITGVVDFDPGPANYSVPGNLYTAKFDSVGSLLWVMGWSSSNGEVMGIDVDKYNNIYTLGFMEAPTQFDQQVPQSLLTPIGMQDCFIIKHSSVGAYQWAKNFGAPNGFIQGWCIELDHTDEILVGGAFSGNANFNILPNYTTPIDTDYQVGSSRSFFAQYSQRGVSGMVYNDLSADCQQHTGEQGLYKRRAIVNPGAIVVETGNSGVWFIDSLPTGTYTVTYDTSGSIAATCPPVASFTVTSPLTHTAAPNFGLYATAPCPSPNVSVVMPFARPCFSQQPIYVQSCNLYTGNALIAQPYTDVFLDTLVSVDSASIPYLTLPNNVFRFYHDTLKPGQCVNFWLYATLSCYTEIGQTICVQANLYPVDTCTLDSTQAPFSSGFSPCNTPWDNSALSVSASCLGDSILFTITNHGSAMSCYSPVRVFVDGQFQMLDSVQLAAQQSRNITYSANGKTWRMEVDQHPYHPGNSRPNATIEKCGNMANWVPGLVTIMPADDADPGVDIHCAQASASYDPNDKTGYPIGVLASHYISPNGEMNYIIRFQNTGNDTAFNIRITDTLDTDLDIFSVVAGASSHPYIFKMHGHRVLEWNFYNIQLPDSNVNEAKSHGFVSFSVKQNDNLPDGTKIENMASIYFDYNSPIYTNTAYHKIYHDYTSYPTSLAAQKTTASITVYPIPTNGDLFVELNESTNEVSVRLFDLVGQCVYNQNYMKVSTVTIPGNGLKGVYTLQVYDKTNTYNRLVLFE